MAFTLSDVATHQEDVRKSRFLVWAAPASTPEQAQAFIASHTDPGATHNCWAWKTGQAYRFNDDGEPAGTAGKPILQAIEGQNLDQVVVLVIRWFGGIKLGTGGLIRAYGGAAAQCLRAAFKTPLLQFETFTCRCFFADLALVQSRFEHYGVRVESEQFDEKGVHWCISLPASRANEFAIELANLTRGQAVFEKASSA